MKAKVKIKSCWEVDQIHASATIQFVAKPIPDSTQLHVVV